ncbi:hypothetical protein XHC_0998 [Xanthomonas hortorum pv. carotae str. M081]|nr:hypothetical protein XHC_0998 [Xanthomonas hortorum pv. carotae str. M081]
MPGGVDDVEAMLRHGLVHTRPERGGGSGGDGDTTLLLLLHPVHHRSAVMDFADLVTDAGVKQDALGGGGLAGIDMSHDAEVAVTLDRGGAGHGEPLNFLDFGWPNAAFRRPSDLDATLIARRKQHSDGAEGPRYQGPRGHQR